jgi:dihydroflavonol-4-reductase
LQKWRLKMITHLPIRSAFVTGATGLLGNNLVRLLQSRGVAVRALVRSRGKAEQLFGNLPVELVTGDLQDIPAFSGGLRGVDVLFHTAAYFTESYKGGKHWDQLYRINVRGTQDLLSYAYSAGIRRIVHTSSVGVLDGASDVLVTQEMRRDERTPNEYFRSKILADRRVERFLRDHAEITACTILPGWMFGPGDMGPTSAGQLVLDFLARKLPGIVPAVFSVVDARDVAEAMYGAALLGRRGERYIVAGRSMTMADVFQALEQVSGVPGPTRRIPMPMLFAIAAVNEVYSRFTGRPISPSMATARLVAMQRKPVTFDQTNTQRELKIDFRSVSETLKAVISWYRENDWLSFKRKPEASTLAARATQTSTNTRMNGVEPSK